VANQDNNAMKKGALLVRDKVRALSFCNEDKTSYFSGSVEASMKKNVLYSIKFSIEKPAEVSSSYCDCPAGAGPHSTCKHIVAGKTYVSEKVQPVLPTILQYF